MENAPSFEIVQAPPKVAKGKNGKAAKPKADKPAARKKAGASETE